MLIDEADLERLYLEIQSTALRDGGITVLILVAPDCDAICTCRMLTDLMRSDNIQYKIRPVSGYADIEAARDSFINQSEQLRSLVFINCGGRVNLDKMFNPTANGKRCFVFDHHRPIHLANIHAGRDVCVLNDGGIHLADIPEAGPDMDDAIYSDDDEDDFDDDFSDEEPAGESLMDDDRAASSASDSSPDSTGSGSRRKRKSPSSSPEDKGAPKHKKNMSAAQRRERRQGLRSYYMISTHGKPSSQTAFNMAIQLTKMNNALLWLAIVGASSHFISERINKGGYESLVATFHEEVKKHNPQSDDHGSMSSVEDAAASVPVAFDQGRISHEVDYRFMLLRNWSLYDAMYYSDYVGSQLRIWTSIGQQNLERLLAKVGIPLQECKQQFCFMSDKMKTRLRNHLVEPAIQAGLDDILFETFSLQIGYSRRFTAADLAHSITALLESQGKAPGEWETAFFRAYDALTFDSAKSGSVAAPLIEDGFQRAKLMQQAIVAKATMIMEKDMGTFHGQFRSLVLDSMSENDNNLFTQPLALARLARFIVKARMAQGDWMGRGKKKPLIMFALDERASTYLVVGVPVGDNASLLPMAFKYAAYECGADVKFNSFDHSVAELPKTSLQEFKMALYSVFAD